MFAKQILTVHCHFKPSSVNILIDFELFSGYMINEMHLN